MIRICRVFIPASVIGLVLPEVLITFFCYFGASVLCYIRNLALSLDTFIIFHTMKVMLFSETAQ